MDVYQKPETDIVLCTEQDSLLGLKLSRTRMAVEPGNAVDPWNTNAGLSEFNSIWDDEEQEEDNFLRLKEK